MAVMIITRRSKKVMINERYMVNLLPILCRTAEITITAENRWTTY
jgi:hypothetical protein